MRRVEQGEPVSRLGTFIPSYCPQPGCGWSSFRGGTKGHSDLEAHLRVVHKDAPVAASPVEAKNGGAGTWGRKPLSREQAITEMTAVLDGLDRVPSQNGWHKNKRRPSLTALRRIFGSYTDAVRACGFEPPATGAAAQASGRGSKAPEKRSRIASPPLSLGVVEEPPEPAAPTVALEPHPEHPVPLPDEPEGMLIEQTSLAEAAEELEAAHEEMEAAQERFVKASAAFAAHPTVAAICAVNGDDWLHPKWENHE